MGVRAFGVATRKDPICCCLIWDDWVNFEWRAESPGWLAARHQTSEQEEVRLHRGDRGRVRGRRKTGGPSRQSQKGMCEVYSSPISTWAIPTRTALPIMPRLQEAHQAEASKLFYLGSQPVLWGTFCKDPEALSVFLEAAAALLACVSPVSARG